MSRCLLLASQGQGKVHPNPMVGAVLVHEGRVIGEGFHEQYGKAHAEVNCIQSVKESDSVLIRSATLYVSLEPCAHFGKTPPCADLIIEKNIKAVVIGCRDPFAAVNGKGMEKLKEAGIEVITGVLEAECFELNKRFFTFHTLHRPYIFLKWAQTGNTKIAHADYSRLAISNEYTNRLVHKWRSEQAAIMIGTNTALFDDPSLTTRLWPGPHPVRLVVDTHLRLPSSLQVFNGQVKTIVFNCLRHEESGNLLYYQVTEDVSLVHQVLNALYSLSIQSVMVEGGAYLLQSFINEKVWDEAAIITNEALILSNGLPAPVLTHHTFTGSQRFFSDLIHRYKKITLLKPLF